MARLVIKNGHQRELCYIENGLRARNTCTLLCSVDNIIGRTLAITRRANQVLTFTSYNYCISIPISLFTMTNCVVRSCKPNDKFFSPTIINVCGVEVSTIGSLVVNSTLEVRKVKQ